MRKIYPKALFIYDTEKDIYTCPADHQLSLKSTVLASENTRSYKLYGCVHCTECEQKKQCTQSKDGRKIKLYPEDKQRDELRLHMATPESKKILSQRKSMVEPVFSALRGIQGLERFRRKGLLAVKLEFTLHAMAYNLSRAVALILWMTFSLLFVQTKIRKRENLDDGDIFEKNFDPFATASYEAELCYDLFGYLLLIQRWGGLGNRLNGQNTKIVSDLLTGVARLHAIDRQRRKRKNPYHRVE